MKANRRGLLAGAALAALMLIGLPAGHRRALAQDMTPRTVSGAVLDASDQPMIGATVFLKSAKTKAIRSFTTVEKGHFYFAQVSKIDDYELWAEKGNKKSAVKTVSSWDTRPKVVVDLKIK